MQTTLFYCCPFSQLEVFLKKHYGQAHYFGTAMGGLVPIQDICYMEHMRDFIANHSIERIVLVQDVSCRFNSMVRAMRNEYNHLPIPNMREIWMEHYAEIKDAGSDEAQSKVLANKLIEQHRDELLSYSLWQSLFQEKELSIQGLITNKQKNSLRALNFDTHELPSLNRQSYQPGFSIFHAGHPRG